MNKSNCIIIHGCADDANDPVYEQHWIPWVKQELTDRGIPTETPHMPEPWIANYEKFKYEFSKYAVNENTILIGHSCGAAFLVQWLGDTKQRINKLVLVAPWKVAYDNDPSRQNIYTFDIDTTIKDRVNDIIMFTADDEEEDGKKSLLIYQEALGGKIIELPDHGHYILSDMGTVEFPELIDQVIA